MGRSRTWPQSSGVSSGPRAFGQAVPADRIVPVVLVVLAAGRASSDPVAFAAAVVAVGSVVLVVPSSGQAFDRASDQAFDPASDQAFDQASDLASDQASAQAFDPASAPAFDPASAGPAYSTGQELVLESVAHPWDPEVHRVAAAAVAAGVPGLFPGSGPCPFAFLEHLVDSPGSAEI